MQIYMYNINLYKQTGKSFHDTYVVLRKRFFPLSFLESIEDNFLIRSTGDDVLLDLVLPNAEIIKGVKIRGSQL